MPQFFISRPIFAWVIAILIMLAGLISLPQLPIAQYPEVAPPQITINTFYPGASPEDAYQAVTRPIEEELNGIQGLLYFESVADTTGSIQITATFQPGTSGASAAVEVQNRVRRVEPRLPRAVTQQGVQVDQARSNFLLVVTLTSTDGMLDAIGLGDYMSRNIIGEIRRVPGVGRAQLFASERAMRIWLDPDKMVGLNLTASDVTAAITAQNAQVAAGSIGSLPNPINQQVTATVMVRGQLTSPDEFGSIVLRANRDGSLVRLRDVARIEVGAQAYSTSARLNGKPAAAIAVQLSPTGNAMATADAVRKRMNELATFFPPGVEYAIPYDTSPFVKVSIEKVIHTLLEAMVLVFLGDVPVPAEPALHADPGDRRAPMALLGTCAVMLLTGFSINVLTMFGMVLAIGILVDDAIVVVENVERIMATQGLPPKEATRKAMKEITGAVIGITTGADSRCSSRWPSSPARSASSTSSSPVDGGVDPVLGLPGAEPDAGAVRHLPEAGRRRPPSRQARLLRLVQPRLRQDLARLQQRRVAPGAARRALHDHLPRPARRPRLPLPQAADLVPAERGPGLCDRQLPGAVGRHGEPHHGRHRGGREAVRLRARRSPASSRCAASPSSARGRMRRWPSSR
jgi:multidrug efflux pump